MSDDATALVEEIAGTWETDDPQVLLFDGDDAPIVAHVDGALHLISSRLVYPRETDLTDLRAAIANRGTPDVVSLSAVTNRVTRDQLADTAEVGDGDE